MSPGGWYTASCLRVELDVASGRLTATRPVYGGNVLAQARCLATPQIAALRPKAYAPLAPDPARQGEVIAVPVVLDATMARVAVVRQVRHDSAGVKLEDATIVVAGGRGLGGPEPFRELQELAGMLGAAMGASRAAVDAGWVPGNWQVGLTGKTITPPTCTLRWVSPGPVSIWPDARGQGDCGYQQRRRSEHFSRGALRCGGRLARRPASPHGGDPWSAVGCPVATLLSSFASRGICIVKYFLAHRAGDRHLSAMHLRDVLHDSESQTCPAALATARLINTVKTLKDTIEVVVRNADPLITHVDDEHVVVLACAHPDATIRIAVGNGILGRLTMACSSSGALTVARSSAAHVGTTVTRCASALAAQSSMAACTTSVREVSLRGMS